MKIVHIYRIDTDKTYCISKRSKCFYLVDMEVKSISRNCLCTMIITFLFFGISLYQYIQTRPKYIYVYKDVIKEVFKDVIKEVFLPTLNTTNIGNKLETKKAIGSRGKNMLDGCYHVYLDVGSNIGVQVRKLYEPGLYPDADVHTIFNSQFGSIEERNSDNRIICAVGFEPNPHHTEYLKHVESSYNKCGWNVRFFTQSAVSDHNGMTQFYSDEAYDYLEWGGGILAPNFNNIAVEPKHHNHNVTLIRLSEFLKDVVATRKLPKLQREGIGSKETVSRQPRVVMKMDIEGSEVDVIPDLIFTGGLQFINSIMVEWHERLEKLTERIESQKILSEVIENLSEYSRMMSTFDFSLVNLDDETYFDSRFDLPKCQAI